MRSNELFLAVAAGVFFLFAPNIVLRDYWPQWAQHAIRLGGGTIVLLALWFYNVYSGEDLSSTLAKKLFCGLNIPAMKLCQSPSVPSSIESVERSTDVTDDQQRKTLSAQIEIASQRADMSNPETLRQLLQLTNRLPEKDLHDFPTDGTGDLTQKIKNIRAIFLASDARIKTAQEAASVWGSNRAPTAMLRLLDAADRLVDFDRRRLDHDLQKLNESIATVRAEKLESDERWLDLSRAMQRTKVESIEYYWRPLKAATERINNLDRQLGSVEQIDLLENAHRALKMPHRGGVSSPAEKRGDFGTIPQRQ
jgi:hypothetical protein